MAVSGEAAVLSYLYYTVVVAVAVVDVADVEDEAVAVDPFLVIFQLLFAVAAVVVAVADVVLHSLFQYLYLPHAVVGAAAAADAVVAADVDSCPSVLVGVPPMTFHLVPYPALPFYLLQQPFPAPQVV